MFNLLDIKDPIFLKELNNKELIELSNTIRDFLVEKISQSGGHLSSNLGIVELTIALHKSFNSPIDKFIFDVGHQSYTHKILTGRAKDFDSLRSYKGLSGFAKLSESPHDPFESGHASNSLSGLLGFELTNKENYNIAVIGDASISAGLAFEAINHIGNYDDIAPIIILNDNGQSISKNIGALHKKLTTLKMSSSYLSAKKIGKKTIPKPIRNLKSKISRHYSSNIFYELGFNYVGPIDGHNFKRLNKTFEYVKKQKKPTIVHVITKKGKGFEFSETDNSGKWHGTSPFDPATGELLSKSEPNTCSWSKAVSDKIYSKMSEDNDLHCITPAMVYGSELQRIEEDYGDRFIDVGMCESHGAVLSAALTLNNKKVFYSIYSTFLQRAYDQVIHDIARQNQNVLLGIDRSGIVGKDGDTHQGIYDISFLMHIPNTVIVMPYNYQELNFFIDYAIDKNKDKVFCLRYPRGNVDISKSNNTNIEFGTWNILREGKEMIIISYGKSLDMLLNKVTEQIDATIVNARCIKPFDTNMFEELLSSNKPILVYEESARNGGLGQILLDYAHKVNKPPKNYHIMAFDDKFVEHGSYDDLLTAYHMDSKAVINKCKSMRV